MPDSIFICLLPRLFQFLPWTEYQILLPLFTTSTIKILIPPFLTLYRHHLPDFTFLLIKANLLQVLLSYISVDDFYLQVWNISRHRNIGVPHPIFEASLPVTILKQEVIDEDTSMTEFFDCFRDHNQILEYKSKILRNTDYLQTIGKRSKNLKLSTETFYPRIENIIYYDDSYNFDLQIKFC